jgi:predicted Rossmann fold flavoprotein
MAKIAIIGAGPAGMMASIFASQAGHEVVIIDTNEHVGRKLLVTGAGRCNLTNADVAAVRYACDNPVWLNQVLNQFNREDLLRFLESIGILTFSTFDGWYYPISESAHAVVDAFDAAMNVHHVQRMLRKQVTGIIKTRDGFEVMLHRDVIKTDLIIIACGGKAYPSLGSDGNLLAIIQQMGHLVHPVLPALAPVTADMRFFKGLQGVRLDADVTLLQGGRALGKTFGNIIFTQWGLNGPGVMDLSYLVSTFPLKDMMLELNLIHKFEDKLKALFVSPANSSMPVDVAIQSILPPKMAAHVIHSASLPPDSMLSKIKKLQRDTLFQLLTHFQLKVTGTRGFDYCQVSTGGVSLMEVNPEIMESLIVPGLFFAGEVLDVVGPCGGYNLQFAFSTGAIAGMGAGRQVN